MKTLPSILQISTSYNQACGVGIFSRNLSQSMRKLGFSIETTKELKHTNRDIVLIQHEFGLFKKDELLQYLSECKQRKVMFVHTATGDRFEDYVDGYIHMCPGMIETTKPAYLFPLPGYYTNAPSSADLKKQYGLDKYDYVLGTNGFINAGRNLPELALILGVLGKKYNWGINLAISRHRHHDNFEYYKEIEDKLVELSQHFPNLIINDKFLSSYELHCKLKACDLIWCWTSFNGNYASATASDQYCTGARMVVCDKPQHNALKGLTNVKMTKPNFEKFVETLVNTALEKKFTRHDGSQLSWDTLTPRLADFMVNI